MQNSSRQDIRGIWGAALFRDSKGEFSEAKVYLLWVIINMAAFIIANLFFNKTFFYYWETDAFFKQMEYVAFRIGQGEILDLLNPFTAPIGVFGIVHFSRFVMVSPFYLSWANEFPPVFDSFFILVFLIPILFARIENRPRCFLQPFFVYLPLFFSFRAVMAMCGIAYLFLYFYSEKKNILILASMFLANLSSGVVLLWIMILFVHRRIIFARFNFVLLIGLSILGLSFLASLVGKVPGFFTKTSLWVGQQWGLINVIETIAFRSTIAVSWMEKDMARFVFYLGMIAATAFALTLPRDRFRIPKEAQTTLMVALFMFLLEGLAAVSSLIVLILFYLVYFNYPWRINLENSLRRMVQFPSPPQIDRT